MEMDTLAGALEQKRQLIIIIVEKMKYVDKLI